MLPFLRVIKKIKGDFFFANERGPWINNQLLGAVAVAMAKHLGVRLIILGWRQVAIAIGNKHLHKASRIWRQRLKDEEEKEEVKRESNSEVK